MVFSSNIFIFWFLPTVLALYYLAPGIKFKNVVLLLMSLLFYMWGESELVLVMIASCILNYTFGLWIDHTDKKKLILGIGVGLNLAILCYFKYTNFFIDNLNAVLPSTWRLGALNILLPIGISFFTFQSISYLVDLYRKEVQVQRSIVKLSLYVALFPQLIAGPIVRYHDIAKSITKREHSVALFNSGVRRFVLGLAKKVLVANVMALVVDEMVSRNPGEMTPFIIWFGLLCFGMQVYYDFSGYSDMAIGLGRMFGFKILENFNMPFISFSFSEFWRRWHISLSSFIRDYLFIPLGGSRVSPRRVYINLFTIFFLTGLWHGANWNYIVWSLYHGMFIIFERIWIGKYVEKHKLIGIAYLFFFITNSWVLFLVESPVVQLDYYWMMYTGGAGNVIDYWPNNEQWVVFFIAYFFAFNGIGLFKWINDKYIHIERYPNLSMTAVNFGVIVLFVVSVMALSSNSYNPFIYFRF